MKDPERLIETDSRAGQLLREMLDEDARTSTRRPLRVPRSARGPALGPWIGVAATVAATALLATRLTQPERPRIEREVHLPAALPPPERVATETPEITPPKADPHPDAAETASERGPRSPSSLIAPPRSTKAGPSCKELTRSGDFRAAIECYRAESTLGGMRAELAWLERARLEQRALHDSRAALATLDDYIGHHPTSSLRTEADLSRIELLTTLGETTRALALVREVRASGRATERHEELLRLERRLVGEATESPKAPQNSGE